MKRTHLPLNALRAFEAAARHLSFTRAADELAVTPAAVGQQIRALEDVLGVVLFKRTARALALTAEAKLGLAALAAGFERFEEAVQQMRSGQASSVLTVAAPTLFASKWMIPRLQVYLARQPQVQVRLLNIDRAIDFSQENIDLAIHFGADISQDQPGQHLLAEAIIPVAAPALAAKVTDAAALAHIPLIHDKSDSIAPSAWQPWLMREGIVHPHADSGLHLSQTYLAIDAAVAGAGAALVSAPLVDRDIAAGRLVHLFAGASAGQPQPTGLSYWLTAPAPQWRQKKVQDFVAWIAGQGPVASA